MVDLKISAFMLVSVFISVEIAPSAPTLYNPYGLQIRAMHMPPWLPHHDEPDRPATPAREATVQMASGSYNYGSASLAFVGPSGPVFYV